MRESPWLDSPIASSVVLQSFSQGATGSTRRSLRGSRVDQADIVCQNAMAAPGQKGDHGRLAPARLREESNGAPRSRNRAGVEWKQSPLVAEHCEEISHEIGAYVELRSAGFAIDDDLHSITDVIGGDAGKAK